MTADIEDFKKMKFPLIKHVSPTLVAKDLVSVQPMTATPKKLKVTWNTELAEDLMGMHGVKKTKKVPKAEDPVKTLMRKIGYDVGEPEYEEVEEVNTPEKFLFEKDLTDEVSKMIAAEIDKEILAEIQKIGQKP